MAVVYRSVKIYSDVPGVFTLISGGSTYKFSEYSTQWGFYSYNNSYLTNFTIADATTYKLHFKPNNTKYETEGIYTVPSPMSSRSPWSFYYPSAATKRILDDGVSERGSALQSLLPICTAIYGEIVPDQNVSVLYIRTRAKTLICTYDGNGGTPSRTSDTVQCDGSFPELPTARRGADVFDGWYTAADGGTKVNSGDKVTQTDNFTLYAHWRKELICTYNPNGGYLDRYFDRVIEGGVFPALPIATFGTETTNRWYTEKTGGTEVHQGDTVTQTDDFTLYAHWSVPVNTHTLTFNANGGTVSPASLTLEEGAAYGTLPTPTRSGYTFVEWRTAPFVGELVTAATTMGTDDVTIYAIWRGNAITITLNANGGTVSPTTKSVENGSVYGILPRPTRSGFIFDGWWTSATGGTKITATDKPSGSQTVYAHWKPDGGEVVPWVF